ncbi:MAG: aminotransferase class I/II-fold pyridoxal phosphate-dependent enzyme [Clostridia bacterium]|nr:aminotransferase class I/II-fold pyridoxal phosphate-dependent enzyme [Clostridia bacterium]
MYRIGQEEIDAVARVIESQELFKVNDGTLQECLNVQLKMEKTFGVKHALFMTSGHAALTSALIAKGIGPGDQVIVPAYTYIATAMAVVAAGAIPVIAEIDKTMTLDVADVERKITPHTKAILPVHIQGFPCNMDAIMEVADKHDLFALEDSCQADGGSYRGKRLGSIGHAGALSFNAFKLISCGEGGALLTDDSALYERALIYHDSSAVAFFGDQLDNVKTKPFCGNEYRMHEIPAAIMRVQLSRMDGILKDLRQNKKILMDALASDFVFAPSHDIEGDCGTTLALQFDTAEEAVAFTEKLSFRTTIPINTGKHIYKHWTPIMEKRGALHPLMDPFGMEANKAIIPDYHENMCPKTLDILARTVYIAINPDMSKSDAENMICEIRK